MHDGLVWFASVVAFAFAMSATPGPNNTLLFRSGARFGYTRTIPHMLGVTIGVPLLFFAVAFGAGSFLRFYPIVFSIMRGVGIMYLLWLAWHIASERGQPMDGALAKATSTRRPMKFLEAVLFQWANPKVWIGATATMLAYTHADARQLHEVIMIILILLCVNPCSCSLWTWLGRFSARKLSGAKGMIALQYGMAALLIVSIIPLVAEQFADFRH